MVKTERCFFDIKNLQPKIFAFGFWKSRWLDCSLNFLTCGWHVNFFPLGNFFFRNSLSSFILNEILRYKFKLNKIKWSTFYKKTFSFLVNHKFLHNWLQFKYIFFLNSPSEFHIKKTFVKVIPKLIPFIRKIVIKSIT